MSLVNFHRFLILAGIAFCLGFAAWQLQSYVRHGADGGALLLAGIFAGLGVALAVYLVRLRSILRLDE